MFSLQSWAWECQWCRLLAASERSTSRTSLLPWVEEIKSTLPLSHTLKWNASISLGFIASTFFRNILQIISYRPCMGSGTNWFPSIASNLHWQISFPNSIYHSSHLWRDFPHSFLYYLFFFSVWIKWVKVNPLIKVKRYNRHYLLLNKAWHFSIPLITSLCHTGIFTCLSPVLLGSVRLIMLVTHLRWDG